MPRCSKKYMPYKASSSMHSLRACLRPSYVKRIGTMADVRFSTEGALALSRVEVRGCTFMYLKGSSEKKRRPDALRVLASVPKRVCHALGRQGVDAQPHTSCGAPGRVRHYQSPSVGVCEAPIRVYGRHSCADPRSRTMHETRHLVLSQMGVLTSPVVSIDRSLPEEEG